MAATSRRLSILAIIVAALAACGTPPAPNADGVVFAGQTVQAATRQVLDVTATYSAVAATRNYEIAVATQSYIDSATAYAQEAATATSVAATVTAEVPIRAEETRVAAVIATRDEITTNMIADSATAQAQLNEQSLGHNEELIRLDVAKRENDERLRNISHITRIVLAVLIILAAAALAVFVIVIRSMAWAAGQKVQRRLLESPSATRPPAAPDALRVEAAPGRVERIQVIQQTHNLLENRLTNWDMFVDWNSAETIPVGVTLDGPVLLDVRTSPHLGIFGSTRMGKSTGGLIPVAGWFLSRGAHVFFLNERASNFSPFYAHPNAIHLRAFTLAERAAIARQTIGSVLREMERRDGVLHRAGCDSWYELMDSGRLATEPELGGDYGQLVVVIDEFLSMTSTSSPAERDDFMRNLVQLTSEAAKFGICLVVAATDPRRDALGRFGYTAMQQVTRMVFGFRAEGPSRSILGDNSAVNLPVGHFVLEVVSGERKAGIAFQPGADGMMKLLRRRPVSYRPVPNFLTPLLSTSTESLNEPLGGAVLNEYTEAARRGYGSQIVDDAQLVMRYADSGLQTRTAIARRLGEDGHVGWGSSGENVRRVEKALEYLSRYKGVVWAADILNEAPAP